MHDKTPELKLSTTRWILAGTIAILLLFGGVGTWAATTRISAAIIAPGTIAVESKIKTVQHLEGGIIGEILVQNGDKVTAGQVLVRLDDTAIRASLAIVTGNLREMEASLARLKAERDESSNIAFPDSLLKQEKQPEIEAMLLGQNSLFKVRRKSRQRQKEILRQRSLQLLEQIKGLEMQRSAKQKQIDIITRSIEKKSGAAMKGVISSDTMDNYHQQMAELSGDVGDIIARIAKTRGSIEEIEQQILQIDEEFREKVLSDIRQTQTSLNELREKKTALEEKLRRVDIRAPQGGRILNLSVFTVGGIISPASPILQIIPENDHLIIESRISPMDVDQITIGQEAAIHLSAFDNRTTPVLMGTVKSRSAAQIIDKASNTSFFNLIIVLPEDQLKRLKKDQKLVPGMPVEVFVQTGERSPLDYFLKPFLDQIKWAMKEK